MPLLDDPQSGQKNRERLAHLGVSDPLGYVDGADLYQFELDVPTRYVDPMGTDATTQPSPPEYIGVPISDSRKFFPNATAGDDPTKIFNVLIGRNAAGLIAGQFFVANKVKCKCHKSIIQKVSNSTTYYNAQGQQVQPPNGAASRNYIEGFEFNDGQTVRPDGHFAIRSIPPGVSKVHYHVEITTGCGTYDGRTVNNADHYSKFGEPGDPNKISFDGATNTLVIDFTVDDGGGYVLQVPQLKIDEHKP